MTQYEITQATNDRGTTQTIVNTFTNSTAVFFFSQKVRQHETISKRANVLEDTLQRNIALFNNGQSDRSTEGNQKAAIKLFEDTSSPFKATLKAGLDFQQETKNREMKYSTPNFDSEKYPVPRRVEIRAMFSRIKSISAKFQFALNTDPQTLACIIEGGHEIAGMPPDLFQRLTDHFMNVNLVERSKNNGMFDLKPSPENLFATGIDQDLALKTAASTVKGWKKDAEVLEELEIYLLGVVDFIAVVTSQSRDQSFDYLIS